MCQEQRNTRGRIIITVANFCRVLQSTVSFHYFPKDLTSNTRHENLVIKRTVHGGTTILCWQPHQVSRRGHCDQRTEVETDVELLLWCHDYKARISRFQSFFWSTLSSWAFRLRLGQLLYCQLLDRKKKFHGGRLFLFCSSRKSQNSENKVEIMRFWDQAVNRTCDCLILPSKCLD